MNKIYKVIWSKVRNCYIVVSELAKSHDSAHGTRSRSGCARKAAVLAAFVLTTTLAGTSVWAQTVTTDTQATNQNNAAASQAVNIEKKSEATAQGSDAYVTYDSEGNLIAGKNNEVVKIQTDTKAGYTRVENQPENVVMGTRNGVGTFTHATDTVKPVTDNTSYSYEDIDTKWITTKVYNPATKQYEEKQIKVYSLVPGQYMDDAHNVRAKSPERAYYSSDADYNKAVEVYNNVATYIGTDSTSKSYYVSGATAVGIDNIAEGTNSTALGNKAKVLNSVSSYYVDAYGKLTSNQEDARYWLDNQGNITTTRSGYYASDGTFVDRYLMVPRLTDSSNAVALGSDVLAVGHDTHAKEYSVAIGEADNTDYSAVAVGNTNRAQYHSVAVGSKNAADGYYSLAQGDNNTVNGDYSNAVGYQNQVSGSKDTSGSERKAQQSQAYGANNTVKGNYSMAYGNSNTVTGDYAVAVGNQNKISGDNTAGADGERAIAIGYNNQAEEDTVTIGQSSQAHHPGSIAIGKNVNGNINNNNNATDSIAIGTESQAATKDSIAFGHGAVVGNNMDVATSKVGGNVAMGTDTFASAAYDVAIGTQAQTASSSSSNSGCSAVAIGYKATVNDGGQRSVALGANSSVALNMHDAVALGSQSRATRDKNNGGYNAAANGSNSYTDGTSTWNSTLAAVSVGADSYWDGSKTVEKQTRQITNVAAGKEDTDAVNVAQLKQVVNLVNNGGGSGTGGSGVHDYSVNSVDSAHDSNYNNTGATGSNALAAGVNASATGVRSVAVGNGAQALKPDSIALGTNAKADGIGATAIGQYNTASGQNSLAFGGGYNKDQKGNTASGVASVAFGEGTQAIAEGTLAFGQNTQAGVITTDDKGNIQIGGQDAVAFGRGTKALGGRSLAFGEDTVADFNDSVAFGAGTKALSTGSTAFGSRTRALAQYSTALGNSTVAAGTYSVAFGTDTVAGAVLDEHGAFQLKNGTKMDQHGNTAYTDSQGKTYSVTYTVPDGEKHSYVVLKGQGGKTYIRDYRGNIRTATIGNDGSVTVGGIVKGATEDKTLIKAKPGSNGYDLISNSNATAWGESSSASGEASTAFGIGSKAEGKNSLAALGGLAANDNSIAIGEGTKANNADKAVSLAIGQNAEASGERSLAIGFGVSEKVNDKDDKTLTSTKASGESAIAIGTDVVAQGQHSVAMGSHTDAAKDSSVAIGFDTHTVSDSAVAIGSGTRAEGRYSVALGLSSVAGKETNDAKNPLNGGGSVAIGYGTSAEASRSIAIGTGATAADSQFTTAVGDSTIAQAEGSVAIGAGSIATRGAGNKESTASTDVNTGKTTITYGDEKKAYLKPDELSTDKTSTWVSTTGAVSVGGQATYKEYNDNGNLVEKTKLLTRQITNVAAGSDDTDAVNVAQLKAAQPTVTSNDHSVTIDTTTDKTDYHKNYDLKIATATLSQDKTTGDNPVETGKVTVSNPKISVTENGETKQVDNPNAYVTGNSVADAINNSGFKLTASASEGDVTGNAETLIHPGDTMTIDAGKNISLTQTNGKISIATKDKLVLGKDTSDGKDGQEGTIGLTGKDGIPGTDGKQGYSTTIIKTEKGQPGSDGKNGKPGVDGKDITRIVYTDKDGSTPQTVATLSDGLKFAGDDISKTVEKKLNETLQIRGDGSYDKTTQKTKEDGNIQVSADTDTGTIKVALNKDINLKQDGSLTVGGNTQDGSKTVDDPIVIKHFDDKTLDMITGVGEDGKPITAKEGKAGDYVTGLDNKAWDVSNPNYVSGRAATEDQLKKVSDAVNKTAGQHTVVTVNDNKNDHDTKAKAGKGAFGDYAGTDKDNLLIAAKDEDGKLTYNIKLNDQLAIGKNGTDGQDGKDGKDGKVTVETSKGTTVVIGHDGEPGKDGKDGLFVTGQDGKDGKSGVSITGPDGVAGKDGVDGKVGIAGKDGKDAVSITGKDGVGHIGLTGPKGDGTPGRDGTSIDILTDYGTKTLDSNKNVTVDNKEQASRIIYNDAKGPHEVATMDDGLKIGANAAAQGETANPVSNKLNSTINIKGSEAKADHTYTDDNLTTTVEQDADGNTTVKVLMDQDITGNSVTVGKDGKAGYDGQEGSIGIAGKDGKDGKQGITTTIIKTEKGQNGKDGEVGKQGAPGVDGKDITRIVYQNGQDGENGQGGKHVVATLDDGLKFAGDNASTTVAKKLNETLQIRGDGTYDKDKKTVADDGNIKTSVEDGTIKVALNKDINLKQTGSLTVGGDTQDGSTDSKDPIVIKHFDDKTLDVIGVDKDGKPTTSKEGKAGDYVTGLDNKDWNVSSPAYVSGRAATEDQLKKVSDAVNSAAATAGKHTVVTVNDKDSNNETAAKAGTGAFGDYAGADKGNLLIAAKNDNGQMTYNIKLNDQLAIGQKGEPGVAGKDGKDGKVTVETKGGTTVVIGHDGEDGKDGISVKGQDGKDGVTISAVNGKDGSEGHIGLTGPKGADGKNATADIHVKNGQVGVDGTDGHGGKDGMDRVVYEDHNGVTHEVATMDDGQKYAGDFGDGASVKLNKTVTIKGKVKDGAKEDDFVDGNIAIVANKKGEDGELLIKLNKDLTGLNSATYTTSTKNGDVTTTSKTVVDGTGLKIDNGPSITNTGIDGGSKKITNVADGEISATSKDAVNGSQLNAVKTLAGQHTTVEAGSKNITVKEGTNSTGGKNYTVDLAKDVAFGDSAKGDKTVAISGTNGTVTAGTGDNKVTVDGSKGQIIAGGDNGVKIGNIAGGDSSLTIYDKDGKATNQTDQAGKYVTNLGNKTWNKDGSYVSGRAATEDQLHQVESNVNKQIADVNTKIDKVDKHHTEVTVNGGTPAKADGAYTDGNLQLKQTTGEDGQKVYDLKLNDQLKVGQKGDAGKAGKDGNVTVETKGGTTVVIGHDGKDGKDGRDGLFVTGKDGKDGKSGVSITGPNSAAGTDGVDGKVGIAGKDGRDAVSIAGKDGVGHIGLTGPKGADGKDGTNIDISTVLGKGTLDRNQNEVKGEDKDGTKDQAARIQYQTTVKEADGTTKTITHEVATMDDGMKYGDDFGNTAKVKLNHQLDIVGDINAGKKDGDKKATKDDLSDGNIGIVATDTVYNDDGTVKENGKMTVKLAKNLKGLNSIESNSVTTGNTTIDNGGLTVKTGDSTHQDITIQQGDVNMGGNKIEGVAPGAVTPDSTDAVNGSQLYAAGQAISNLGGAVNKLGTRVDRVGAGSAALAALHPLDFDPDDKWDFAAGYGHYRGANAAAVGAYYRPNEDTMFSIGGSFGGGENMFNAGVSIKLGQGNHISTSRVAMAKEIKDLRENVAQLNQIVNRQSALIEKLTSVDTGSIQDKVNDLFPDVPENHWAYEYVSKLAKAGILKGYPDGNFAGDRMMTRYEFAAIVYRAITMGAASDPSLNQDGTLGKLAKEFNQELKFIRIDTIHHDAQGEPTVQRVRVQDTTK